MVKNVAWENEAGLPPQGAPRLCGEEMEASVLSFCREQRDYVAGLIQQLTAVPDVLQAYTNDAGAEGPLRQLAGILPQAVPEDSPAELADFIRNPLFLRSPDANAR